MLTPAYVAMLHLMDFVSVNSVRDAATARQLLGEAIPVHVLPALAAPVPEIALDDAPSTGPLRVAFIGNVGARVKGAHKLLDLWRKARYTDMSLTLYGPNAESLGEPSDLPMVRAAGPFQPDQLSEVFAQVDLLVHPADDESLGLVLIEAMAHGVPFIATHAGGMIDIAQDNPHVMTVPDDPASLRAAIELFREKLRHSRAHRAALQAIYRERWSHMALGQRWLAVYKP